MHSADVLVFLHGSGSANEIFMRNNTAVLEVMPRGFASMYDGIWARIFYADTAKYAQYRVRYFALNVEDPDLSRAGPYEEADFGDGELWIRDRCAVASSSSLVDRLWANCTQIYCSGS
jgi:hypothetical protein